MRYHRKWITICKQFYIRNRFKVNIFTFIYSRLFYIIHFVHENILRHWQHVINLTQCCFSCNHYSVQQRNLPENVYRERTNIYPKSFCPDIGKFQSTGRCFQVCGNTLDMLIMINHNMETHICMCCDDITEMCCSDITGDNLRGANRVGKSRHVTREI